jgi:hypothetical protein
MPYNGSGVHTRVHDWTTDLANTVPVTASRMDAEHDDISTALSNTICRDGQSTTSARIPFAAGVSSFAGTTSSVSYAQSNDTNTGLYFPAADQWGLVAGGTATLTSTSTGLSAAVTLSPALSDGAALGTSSLMWSDLFLASGAVVNWNNGDVTLTHAANALSFEGGTVKFDTAPTPTTSDAAALGTSSVMWSDLFLASGAVINFNNGDVTATHSANTLAFAGASSGYTFDAQVAPSSLAVTNNATVGGTLGVTGATTLTGALTANNSAGVTARNTAKAFVWFQTDGSANVTIHQQFNITSVAIATVESVNGWRLTMTNALPSAVYGVIGTARIVNQVTVVNVIVSNKSTTTVDFIIQGAGQNRNNIDVCLWIFENG